MMKVVRTVWSGGKVGDNIKYLPITIVYGIAITAMSFFTDPTISMLTSGKPSQNVDLAGMSFPRRIGFRLNSDFVRYYHLLGMQCIWHAYEDEKFIKLIEGKDFYHEDLINTSGWARYYFKGVFPNMVTYLKCEIKNPQSGQLIRTFYFKFTKTYQVTLNGRTYAKDPILQEKIVKDGLLQELRPVKDINGDVVYKPGYVTYKTVKMKDIDTHPHKEETKARAVIQHMTRYSEKAKMVFLVTPPHLMKYAKLILILIKQLVDLNFDQSYMTKSSQKPLYKTRFMLDELGNLQSEGHGIEGFQTMLSIGLGQEQQFTLILQTLQQLKDVYGESVDKIVQGNAQPLHSKVLTPYGWKNMGEIKLGDDVLTPFGTITKVTGVYPKGVRPVYGLRLCDGSYAESCDEHLWMVERPKTNSLYQKGMSKQSYIRTKEVLSTLELKKLVDNKRNYISLPKIEPVVYTVKNLPIHPYVFGILLGDANFDKKGYVALTFSDDDIEIKHYMESLGYSFTRNNGSESDKTLVYYVKNVCSIIRDLGLAGKRSFEKSIPDIYMQGSVEQRVELLRGLMDSDGTISKNGEMEFSSSSEILAKNVQTLIRSLGGRVSINVKENVYYTSPSQYVKKKARAAYRVQNIRLFDINPFRLSRKANRYKMRSGSSGNRIVSITYLRDEPVQCIRVADERHLYITDDFIPTHNTSNIVFLKSTDDSMLDTLQKMSGTTHKAFKDSKTVTRDMERILLQNEGKVSYTVSTKEIPVISYNDMAFISERNSIVFRAGDSPIWNRNETILPMSWRLLQNTIKQPGKDYTFQTIPTLSSAKEFDRRKNQPDFGKMVDKRMAQAIAADNAKQAYQSIYGYSEWDIAQLDPDLYAFEIMEVINASLQERVPDDLPQEFYDNEYEESLAQQESFYDKAETNYEQLQATAKIAEEHKSNEEKRFAGKTLSRNDLAPNGVAVHAFDKEIIKAFIEAKGHMCQDKRNFFVVGDALMGRDNTPFIVKAKSSQALDILNKAQSDPQTQVYGESSVEANELKSFGSYIVSDDFIIWLSKQERWNFANNEFEKEMARLMQNS